MNRTKLALLAFTVFGAFACSESRNLVGKGNPDGAAGSGGNVAGSGGGSGPVGSGGATSTGGGLQSGGALGGGGTTSSSGALGGGGSSGGTGGVGTGGVTGTGGQRMNDAAADGNPDVSMSSDAQALAELCVATGGKVETLQCCPDVGAFPNSCLAGACGCDPAYGQPLTVCTCPTATCFLPATGCVPRDSGDAGGASQDVGIRDAAPDVASDSLPSSCPSSVPSGSCSLAQDTLCYYGDDSRWFCKTSALCTQGTWQVTAPLTGCIGSLPAACPSAPGSNPAAICNGDGGITGPCVYATKFCRCGYTGLSVGPGWVCSEDLPADCPALPPAEGSPCTVNHECTYGPICSGQTLGCVGSQWVTRLVSC